MKATEFDKINPLYRSIISKTNERVADTNIGIWDYLGPFISKLSRYLQGKERVEIVKTLDFRDKVKVRAILNKNTSSRLQETFEAKRDLAQSKQELFDWLDKTSDPYFFILNPVFLYQSGGNLYKQTPHPGSHNVDIAIDYAKYKLGIEKIKSTKEIKEDIKQSLSRNTPKELQRTKDSPIYYLKRHVVMKESQEELSEGFIKAIMKKEELKQSVGFASIKKESYDSSKLNAYKIDEIGQFQIARKVAIKRGCNNGRCFCTGECNEIIGYRDKLPNEN